MPFSAAATRSDRTMLDALRGATRAQHVALDAALGFRPETITRAQYVAFLRAMLAVVAPLEARIGAVPRWAGALPDGPRRARAALIAADLRALGAHEAAPAYGPALPAVDDVAQAFGCSYVLEGSTLGGVVLARAIGPALGLSPASGMAFWTSYGAEVGAMWRGFLAALEAWAARAAEAERQRAVESAVGAFDAFLQSVGAAGAARPSAGTA